MGNKDLPIRPPILYRLTPAIDTGFEQKIVENSITYTTIPTTITYLRNWTTPELRKSHDNLWYVYFRYLKGNKWHSYKKYGGINWLRGNKREKKAKELIDELIGKLASGWIPCNKSEID